MFLGSIPKMTQDNKVFLSDILNLPRGDYKTPKLVKLARLLQSLDTTPPDDNKIVLDITQVNKLLSTPNQTIENFTLDTLTQNGITLVSKEEAKQRVKATLIKEKVTPLNISPIAKAGENKTIQQGTTLILDGNNSIDKDGSIVKYEWLDENNQLLKVGQTYTTNSLSIGVHTITLKVTDDEGETGSDSVTITIIAKSTPTPQPTPDTTKPTVTSTSPANTEQNVSRDTNLTIIFSEPMNRATLNKSNITLTNITDSQEVNLTNATFLIQNSNKTLTIALDTNLSTKTKEYTLTLTKALQDINTNPLANDVNITFYTEDKESPRVTSTSPANNATNVKLDSNITITFSESIQNANTSTIKLEDNASTQISGTVTPSSGTTITFNPNANLSYNKTYTLTITTGIKDSAGNTLTRNVTKSFKTLVARFERNAASQTVIDHATGRMWQDDSSASTITRNWNGAINYCKNLIFAGHSDWRLPSLVELRSIVDRSRPTGSQINIAFTNFSTRLYWSSTEQSASSASSLQFSDGSSIGALKNLTLRVRCVR